MSETSQRSQKEIGAALIATEVKREKGRRNSTIVRCVVLVVVDMK